MLPSQNKSEILLQAILGNWLTIILKDGKKSANSCNCTYKGGWLLVHKCTTLKIQMESSKLGLTTIRDLSGTKQNSSNIN